MAKNKSRKFFKWLSKKSVIRQVTLIYSIIILVPSILIGVALIYMMYTNRMEEEDRNSRQYVQQIRRNMIGNKQTTESWADKMKYDTEFHYYLYYGEQDRIDSIYDSDLTTKEKEYYLFHGRPCADRESLELAYLQNRSGALSRELVNHQLLAFQRNVSGAKLSDRDLFLHNTISLYSENYLISEDRTLLIWHADKVEGQPYYKDVIENEGKTFWGEVRKPLVIRDSEANYKVMPSDIWVIPYYSKILRPSSNTYLGFLEYDMRLDRMAMVQDVLDSMAGNPDAAPAFVFWDKTGQVCYSSSKKIDPKKDSMPTVQGSGVTELVIGGVKHRVVYDTLEEFGLSIGTIQPNWVIVEQVLPAVLIVVTALFGGMVLVMVLSRRVAQNLFLRLTDLDKHIDRLRVEGVFDQIEVNGQDEIARISSSVNMLMLRLNKMVANVVEKETAQRDAEMRALQAQINPHFLYNTLENLRMQCEMDEYYTISDKLFSLAKLMRYSIQRTGEPSTLANELQALENYADLMSMRVSCEVTLDIVMDHDLLQEQVPKMILQPMLENAFAHAIPRKQKHFRIVITGHRSGDYLILMIQDDGKGMPKELLDDIRKQLREGKETLKSGSIGLTNVNNRLKMQYGGQSGLKIYSSSQGTMVCLVIKKSGRTQMEEEE